MTPHHEERAIWRGDGGKPSALGLLAAACAVVWLWLYALLRAAGVFNWEF